MTPQEFVALNDQQKVELIFDADKISEKADAEANYQLFYVNNFFIEVKTSLDSKFKRLFSVYTLKNLPVGYAGEVLSIPIVTAKSEKPAETLLHSDFKEEKISVAKTN